CFLPIVLVIAAMAGSSFIPLQKSVTGYPIKKIAARDTLPKTEFETGRLDDALNYLDEQVKGLSTEWTDATREKVQQQIDAAMAQVDLAKVKLQAMEAVKKLDWNKINQDIKTATARINTAAMEKNIAAAMRRSIQPVDQEKIKSQVDAAMRNVNLDAIKIQIEDARKKMQDQDFHFKQLAPRINNELLKTRRHLQRLKDASLQMQREGLIDKGLDNKIQYIDGKLFINGMQQSDKVSERYKHYFMEEAIPAPEEITTVVV
ncbi:MAG: hypothetical protein J7539_10115, partial [Niabella sp.]|nr:hypothetical protein [Niabella sp.]